MQGLRFIISPSRDRWRLSVGSTFLGEHLDYYKAIRAAIDMARRTGGNNRVLVESHDGGFEQHWPS